MHFVISNSSTVLMMFLSRVARDLGIAKNVYIVGGAPRNFVLGVPIKDIDCVVDSVALGQGRDAKWFARQVGQEIPVPTSVVTNQYGVAIITIKGSWIIDDVDLRYEVIEIANARKESYGVGGYKPHKVEPATIDEDITRRDFRFNTLLWRLYDVASGPDLKSIIDITGFGLKDIEQKILRTPLNPNKTFSDDPSRLIRVVKFTTKYGFKIAPDVKAAIKRNAPKLKNIPSSHLSNMIVGLFFEPGYGSRALGEMNKLGLLDVVREIAAKDKSFREALANWSDRSAKVDFLFELMDYNMPTGRRLKFLSKKDLVQLRDITAPMSSMDAERIIAPLEQPGKLVNMKGLISEFGLKGQEIKKLTGVLRQIILDNPRMVLTPARLEEAARKRMGKTAKMYTEKDLEPALRRYQESLYAVLTAYAKYNTGHENRNDNAQVRAYGLKLHINNSWVKLIMAGRGLAEIALDQKSIPKGQAKKMEMAVRLFMAARAFPRNFDTWLDRNTKHINYLKTTLKWDDKTEGGGELFKLGPFEVHNIIGATDKELETIKTMFSKAISLVKKAGGPASGLKKTLYGDIYVVGRLNKANWAAWYDISKDFIYTRNLKRAGLRDVRTVIHELSHRYYRKNLSNDIKKRWRKHHIQVANGSVKVVIPKKGEHLPFAVNGVKNPKVLGENVLDGTILLDISKKHPGIPVGVSRHKIYKWMREEAEALAFPTRYSATNEEEHFCDAMALYVLGDLDKDHTKALVEVFTGKDTGSSFVTKTAVERVVAGFVERKAKTFTINKGEPVVFGKYKNKKGTVVGFKTDAKGDVVVIIEPYPKGKKKNQEVKLFKIRPDKKPREDDRQAAVDRIASKFQKKKEVPKADGKGTTTVYEYSEGQIQTRNRDKAKRIEALRGKLDKLHISIKKDLKSKDPQTKMTALAIGLINDVFERVGNASSAKDGHFGVTGWQTKHVTLGNGKATFKYTGKSGVSQTKVTTDKSLVGALKDALKGKSGSDSIFKMDGFTVDSGKVNAYLKPFDITAKDIRGLHANREVQKALKSIRSSGGKLPTDPKEKEKKLKAEFQKAIEQAAQAVGHEASTLKNQYLVPGLEDNYLRDGSVKENLARQKKASVVATKDHGEREDEEAARLVKPLPKKNPPRHDLRRERMQVDRDKDTGGNKADNDKDMSLNYKRVAVDHLVDRWNAKYSRVKRRPGDIWKTPNGWSVKLDNKNTVRKLDSEATAKEKLEAFRNGGKPEDESSGKKKPVDEPSGEKKPVEDESTSGIRKDFSGVDKKSPIFKELSDKHGKDLVELSLYMQAIADGVKIEIPNSLVKTKAFKDLGMPISPRNRNLVIQLMKASDNPWSPVVEDWVAAEKAAKPKDESVEDESISEELKQDYPKDEMKEELTPKQPVLPKSQKQERFEEAAIVYKDFIADVKSDKRFKSVLKEISSFDNPQEVMKSFQDQVTTVRAELDKGNLSPETIQAASEALENPSGDGMGDSKMVGQTLAMAMVAKKLIANPLYMGGLSSGLGAEGTLSSDEDLIPKAKAASTYYSSLTSVLRQEAIAETKKLFKGLEEDSTQRNELDKLADGIHHAASVQGDYDDPRGGNDSLRPPPGPGLRSVLRVLATKGEDDIILNSMVTSSGQGLNSSDAKNQIKKALMELSDDDLYEACGGENGPDSITIDLLQNGGLSSKELEYVKDMLIEGLTGSISSHDEMTTFLAQDERVRKQYLEVPVQEKPQDKKLETVKPGDSESPISHEDTKLCWECSPEGGGETLQEITDNIENSVRKSGDEMRGSMVKCMIKATDPDQYHKCIEKVMRKPKSKKMGSNEDLQSEDPWQEALNVYRLGLAEVQLRAVEETFGELLIDEPFKVRIQTAIKLFDAEELDKRYIREGEKLGTLL